MIDVLLHKLEHYALFTREDRKALENIEAVVRRVPAQSEIMCEDIVSSWCHVIIDGIAARQKFLRDGHRHIVAYLLPGDLCNLNAVTPNMLGYSVSAITSCTFASIPRASVTKLVRQSPAINQAFAAAAFVDEAILREWLINLGRRPVDQRIAHLICELFARLEIAGHTSDGHNELPLKQIDLADTLGISAVHANRILQQLRRKGLVKLGRNTLTVPDLERLKQYAGFGEQYLHLRIPPAHSSQDPLVTPLHNLHAPAVPSESLLNGVPNKAAVLTGT